MFSANRLSEKHVFAQKWTSPPPTPTMRWLIVVGVMVAHSAMASAAPASNHVPRFCQTGTNREESFAFVSSTHQFDVVNAGDRCVMLRFEPNTNATLSPPVVRLGPGDRKSVTLSVRPGIKSVSLCYAVSRAKSAFRTHANRYRAYCDGETVLCVPVEPAAHQSLQARLRSIVNDSKTLVTDEKMPATTYIYTPGPFYRKGGVFARDFLYQLEGGGRDTVTAEEVKRAVEFLALKQLKANKTVGPYTFPKGAIPDHVYPDGRYSWGPGEFHGDVNGHFNRPSMDEAFCFVTLAWHYGYKAGWDAAWRSWFKRNAQPLADAWQSVPRNPKTGLITQWTTAGHLGAAGIAETTGPCVMWGFHDSYGFPGDDLGTSVLACNAARALADMYDHVSDAASGTAWAEPPTPCGMRFGRSSSPRDICRGGLDRVRRHGVARHYGLRRLVGYSHRRTSRCRFRLVCQMLPGRQKGWRRRRFVSHAGRLPRRRAHVRKTDDRHPGSHVWRHVAAPHWENLAYGYNAYQDGGYWYYMSLGVATTLWRKHPAEAKEWVAGIYHDLAAASPRHPHERIDGPVPVNDRYNASVGQLSGIGMPAVCSTISVTVAAGQSSRYTAVGNDLCAVPLGGVSRVGTPGKATERHGERSTGTSFQRLRIEHILIVP